MVSVSNHGNPGSCPEQDESKGDRALTRGAGIPAATRLVGLWERKVQVPILM